MKDYDDNDDFSAFAVFDLRIKSFYLQNLYIKAAQYYDNIKNFKDIAALALVETNKQLHVLGTKKTDLHIITCYETLLNWFCMYRDHDAFPNSSKLRSPKSKLPYFLSCNPDVSTQIIGFCKENLPTLSLESVYCHIHDVIIPNLVQIFKMTETTVFTQRMI